MDLDYLSQYSKEIDLEFLRKLKQQRLAGIGHDYTQLIERIEALNSTSQKNFTDAWITLGNEADQQAQATDTIAKDLIPWRKGPFQLHASKIDAEWRSDFKWDRIKQHLPDLANKKVLDIGCNNGYFMFRMAQDNPQLVMGIEPVAHNYVQFKLINQLAALDNLKFELFGVEHLNRFENFFDVIFSMGIIYHHRHPIQQLLDMKNAMTKDSTLIIETIGIAGEESIALFPEDRYAKMRNIWFVPTLSCFTNWIKKAKFKDVEVIYDIPATDKEQRLTDWCPPPRQSFADFLDPQDSSKTIEGHPAPRRFCIKATKR